MKKFKLKYVGQFKVLKKENGKTMQLLGFMEKASAGFSIHSRFKESCFGIYCKGMGMLAKIRMFQ